MTIRRYNEGVNKHGWHSFSGKLWQRSYYDCIMHSETEMNKIRPYICNNPGNWDTDENNIELKEKTGQTIQWHAFSGHNPQR